MKPILRSFLLCAGVLVPSARPVVAQTLPEIPPSLLQVESFPFPPWVVAGGNSGRSVAGALTGNGNLDVVVLCGTGLVLRVAPAMHLNCVDLPLGNAPEQVADMDILPRVAGSNPADSLVYVSLTGLHRWTWDPVTAAATTTTLAQGSWLAAHFVRVADLDGDGRLDVAGIGGAAGKTVVTLLGQPSGGFVAGPTFELPEAPFAFETIDWSLDGCFDLSVVSPSGFQVCSATGAVLASVAYAANMGTLSAMGRQGPDAGRVVWSAPKGAPGAGHGLAVLQSQMTLDLTDLFSTQVGAFAVGDLDGNGLKDVVLTDRLATRLDVLLNSGGANPWLTSYLYVAGHAASLTLGGAHAPENLTRVCLADLDGDGDVDGEYLDRTAGLMVNVRNALIDHTLSQLLVIGGTVTPTGTGTTVTLDTQFRAVMPAAATHAQVLVWTWLPETEVAVPTGIANELTMLATAGTTPVTFDLTPGLAAAGNFILVTRGVRVENGKVVLVFPPWTAQMSLVPELAAVMLQAGGIGIMVAGREVGAVTPTPYIPPPPPECPIISSPGS
jgi:hypothetical protein